MASRAPAGDDDDGDRGAAAAASALAPPATVAVTGANGFIGQHVVAALLAAGYGVVGTARTAAPAGGWRPSSWPT